VKRIVVSWQPDQPNTLVSTVPAGPLEYQEF
jgi:hypothetical protein